MTRCILTFLHLRQYSNEDVEISIDNKKNYNMILSCYKKGRATVFTDINF